MVYEALLLFGVGVFFLLLFDPLTQSRHALKLRHARGFFLFLVYGLYFAYFWCRSGQTLAMKTWRLKLVAPGLPRLPLRMAVIRYLLIWIWFLPVLAVSEVLVPFGWANIGLICVGFTLWAMTALFDKDRQFLHDKIAGTRLIHVAPVAAQASRT
jgi:uncharacterized RDD family membrane protein YckC